jgi:hypothetical protein
MVLSSKTAKLKVENSAQTTSRFSPVDFALPNYHILSPLLPPSLSSKFYTRVKILGKDKPGNTKGGKYHCTIDLLFDWFGLVCFENKNKNCQ